MRRKKRGRTGCTPLDQGQLEHLVIALQSIDPGDVGLEPIGMLGALPGLSCE